MSTTITITIKDDFDETTAVAEKVFNRTPGGPQFLGVLRAAMELACYVDEEFVSACEDVVAEQELPKLTVPTCHDMGDTSNYDSLKSEYDTLFGLAG